MSVAYRLFLAFVAAGGAYLVASGWTLKYWGVLGPGPGFFPIWIGGLLVVCSLLALWRGSGSTARFVDGMEAARRVTMLALALAALWVGIALLGFRLATFVFLLIVPGRLDAQSAGARVLTALALSFGAAFVFERWLGVELPAPAFEILRQWQF